MDGLTLQIEAMTEHELLREHMKYMNQCMEYDLREDISDRHCYRMREMLGKEIRIRMSAE